MSVLRHCDDDDDDDDDDDGDKCNDYVALHSRTIFWLLLANYSRRQIWSKLIGIGWTDASAAPEICVA